MREQLTGREREILTLIARGHTSREIGAKLFLSQRTIEAHRSNMLLKLGLKSRADLVGYAVSRGLLGDGLRSHCPSCGEPLASIAA